MLARIITGLAVVAVTTAQDCDPKCADLDGGGSVDVADLLVLLAGFGSECLVCSGSGGAADCAVDACSCIDVCTAADFAAVAGACPAAPAPPPAPGSDVANVFWNVVTGGDPGEGCDFTGTFTYAVNILGPGGFTIGDAAFTDDQNTAGFTVSAQNEIMNWGDASEFGTTDNDQGLEKLAESIRWSGFPSPVSVDLDVEAGAPYRLQMGFNEKCCTRGFDIVIDGTKVVEDYYPFITQGSGDNVDGTTFSLNTAQMSAVTYDYIAPDAQTNIVLGGIQGQAFDTLSVGNKDKNPILNFVTLSLGGANQVQLTTGLDAGISSCSWDNCRYSLNCEDQPGHPVNLAVGYGKSPHADGGCRSCTGDDMLANGIRRCGATSMSSMGWGSPNNPDASHGEPGVAIDGNPNSDWGGGSCTHTDLAPAWWQVDLGQQAAVSQVKVWHRTNCCQTRLETARIYVSQTSTFDAGDNRCDPLSDATNEPEVTNCNDKQGRYVSVYISKKDDPLFVGYHEDTVITLCELEVWGQPKPGNACDGITLADGENICTGLDTALWHASVDMSLYQRNAVCDVHAATSGTTCNDWCGAQGRKCMHAQDQIGGTPENCGLDENHLRQRVDGNGCNQAWGDQVCGCSGFEVPRVFDANNCKFQGYTAGGDADAAGGMISMLNAERMCIRKGGHLASIHSDADNAAAFAVGGDGYWIGFHDIHFEVGCTGGASGSRDGDSGVNGASGINNAMNEFLTGFIWTDGSVTDYANWANGEPNDWNEEAPGNTDPTVGAVHGANCAVDGLSQTNGRVGEDCTHLLGDALWNDALCIPDDLNAGRGRGVGYICSFCGPVPGPERYELKTPELNGGGTKMWGAEQACVRDGGHLASAHSVADGELLKQMAADIDIGAWIGFHDAYTEVGCVGGSSTGDGSRVAASNDPADHATGFIWTDGTVTDYMDWSDGEPNDWTGAAANCDPLNPTPDNGGEDCTHVLNERAGQWNDCPCDDDGVDGRTKRTSGFICGYNDLWRSRNWYQRSVGDSSTAGIGKWTPQLDYTEGGPIGPWDTIPNGQMAYDAKRAVNNGVSRRIVMDGDLGDWDQADYLSQTPFWPYNHPDEQGNGAGGHPGDPLTQFEAWSGGIWNGVMDQSSATAFAWDASAIYAGIKVFDDQHQQNGETGWDGDSVQIVLADPACTAAACPDPSLKKTSHYYNYGLSEAGVHTVHISIGPAGHTSAVTRDEDLGNTVYEVKWPVAIFGIDSFTVGYQLGIGICVNEGDLEDGQGGQKGWSGWGPYAIVYGDQAGATGLVTLVGEKGATCPPPQSICPILADTVGFNGICVDGGAGFCEVKAAGGQRSGAAGGTDAEGFVKTCQSFCDDAGLACLDGWDDLPTAMGGDGCLHWDEKNTAGSLCDGIACADNHGDRLVDMAVHGCLNPMGGQVCKCGVASACGMYADFPYNWVDLSESADGTKINAWTQNGDDGWFDLDLPFSFPWYGLTENKISIGTNGVITFGSAHLANGGSEPIPSGSDGLGADGRHNGAACRGNDMVSCGGLVDGLLAPYWADLNPSASSTDRQGVFYAIDDGAASAYCPGTNSWCNGPAWQHVVVEYADMNYWAPEAVCGDCAQKIHFEAILFGDGAFMFQYKNMDPQHVSWSAESIGWEDQTGKFGMQISYGIIPAPETAYFVPACATNLPNEGDGTCSAINAIDLDDLPRSLGCKMDESGSFCRSAVQAGNANCEVDSDAGDYAGGHFATCTVVGLWHLDGNGFDSGPGQNAMVPSIDASSHVTSAIYVAGFTGLGYYGAGGAALLVEDPPGTTDSVIDLIHVTMAAWINPASLTGLTQEGSYGYHQDLMIVCKEEAYEMALKSDTSGMPTGTFSSAMKTSGNGGGWDWSDGTGVAPLDTWTWVASTQDADAGEAKYLNGVAMADCTKCARNSGDIILNKPFPLKIGARVRGADQGDGWTQITDENVVGDFGDHTTTHSSPFHGTIDEVIILRRAATADEILQIYALYA